MLVTDRDRNIGVEQKKDPQRLEVRNIEGYQHIDVKWIVRGGDRFTVKVESVKGGTAVAKQE
jgi:hypothetical protein